MTTTQTITGLPPMRPFTPQECRALAAAGIIAPDEQAAVLTGARPFTADEFQDMEKFGILHEDDRLELIDGKIIIMSPIGDSHEFGTDWLTMLLAPALAGRAMVRVQGTVRLNDRTTPQPDIIVYRMRPFADGPAPRYPSDVHFIIEVANTSLRYDSGPKLARYAAAGIPEVWIANLRNRQVAAHTDPVGDQYTTTRTYHPGQTITPQAFPDIALPINDFMPPTPSIDL